MSRIRTALAIGLTAAAGAAAVVPATASAQKGLDVIYTLTPKEKKAVCGNFQGTIIYSDGFTVDCMSGHVEQNS